MLSVDLGIGRDKTSHNIMCHKTDRLVMELVRGYLYKKVDDLGVGELILLRFKHFSPRSGKALFKSVTNNLFVEYTPDEVVEKLSFYSK